MNTTTRLASLLVRYAAASDACQVAKKEWERAYDANDLDAMSAWLGIWDAAAKEWAHAKKLVGEAEAAEERALTAAPRAKAVAELMLAAGKAQDPNRNDYVLGRPDVSGLPAAERAAFLRGWDAASEAVYRTGMRTALARCERLL